MNVYVMQRLPFSICSGVDFVAEKSSAANRLRDSLRMMMLRGHNRWLQTADLLMVRLDRGMSDEDILNTAALFDAATVLAIAEQIKGAEGAAARGAFLDGMITKGIPEDLKAWLLQENLRVNAVHIADLLVDHCSIDRSDIFTRIYRPTLVIGGRVSHVNPRLQEWIYAQIKGSQLVIFEEADGGAHFSFIETPARFNEVLASFLAEQ